MTTGFRKSLASWTFVAMLCLSVLAGCAPYDLPQISKTDVASGRPLPQGILPNGIEYEPWFQ